MSASLKASELHMALLAWRAGDITMIELKEYLKQVELATKRETASDIFNLAHQYARDDTTMIGAEELRSYHYYNAIAKIGEFDGR